MHLILNNIIFSQQKAGGISLLWSEIIKYIINKNIKCLFVEYECAEKNVYRQQLDINYLVIKKNKYHNIGSLISNIFKIYTRQNYVCLSSDYNLQISKKIANVIVVHDFINELYEKRIFIKLFKTYIKKRAIIYSDAIICVSENTKKDLIKIYPRVNQDKVFVVYNCVSSVYTVINKTTPFKNKFPKKNYVLFVGRRNGYKNFKIVVKALHLYSKISLIIVGGGDLSIEEINILNSNIGDSRYIHYNGIRGEELNLLYNNAYALIYPSEYEGFGIPIIEAQAAGCPVITSYNSSIPEVGGLGCLYVDNITADYIYLSLVKLEDTLYRKNLINLGLLNYTKYSQEKTGSEYIKICEYVSKLKFNT